MIKKIKPITSDQLLFVWRSLHELQAYLNNQIEAGAESAIKDSNDAKKAMKLISRERRRLLGFKK